MPLKDDMPNKKEKYSYSADHFKSFGEALAQVRAFLPSKRATRYNHDTIFMTLAAFQHSYVVLDAFDVFFTHDSISAIGDSMR